MTRARCTEVVEQVSAYLDRDLPARARRRVARHLRRCAPCAEYARQVRSVVRLLSGV